MKSKSEEIVYSKNIIEFVTVANEFCLFAENALEYKKGDYIDRLVKMLSLLYLKTSMLPTIDTINEEGNEKFVSEFEWQLIKNNISTLLENDDMYLDYFDSNMEETAEPVTSSISENIADIYQDLKDFVSIYKINIPDLMNDALVECVENFKAYWGHRVVNSLRILHWLNNRVDDSREFVAANHRSEQNSQPESFFKKKV